jgi:hypothetical protein
MPGHPLICVDLCNLWMDFCLFCVVCVFCGSAVVAVFRRGAV